MDRLREAVGQMHGVNPGALIEYPDEDGDGLGETESHYSRGEAERQVRIYQESLDHFREVGSRDGEAGTELKLSVLYGELRAWEAALEHAERAQQIYEEMEEAGPAQDARDNLAMARLQSTLAKVELAAPPPISDDDEGE